MRPLPSAHKANHHPKKKYVAHNPAAHSLSLSPDTLPIFALFKSYIKLQALRVKKEKKTWPHISSRPTSKVVVPIQSNWFHSPPHSPSYSVQRSLSTAHWSVGRLSSRGNCYYDNVCNMFALLCWGVQRITHRGGGYGELSVCVYVWCGQTFRKTKWRPGEWIASELRRHGLSEWLE